MVLTVILSLTVCVIVVGFVALIALGNVQLRTSAARIRDGLLPGDPAPPIESLDLSSPEERLLLFADHSIIGFPGLVDELSAQAERTHVLILSRRPVELVGRVLRDLGLSAVDFVKVTDRDYANYYVSGMPFVTVVKDAIVRSAGPVSAPGALIPILRMAEIDARTLREYLLGTGMP